MSYIQQIKQDLEVLEQMVTEVSEELQQLYANYFDALGNSTQKQLILASYQICTQIYPESFLRLSLSQRQKLQQNLRQLGKDIKSKLLDHLQASQSPQKDQEAENLDLVEAMIKNLPFVDIANNEEVNEDLELDLNTATSETWQESQPEIANPTQQENEVSLPEEKSELNEPTKLELNNPYNLILWQQQVEKGIKQSLDEVSREANKCLQEANIIPSRLPTKIMDVAIGAEEATLGGNKVHHLPNVLNIVVETEKDKKSSQANITQISLLRLRLSEIEFADSLLNIERGKIRNLLKKVQKLKQQYQAKQREYASAEAEAAWRSSWYEE
ncbi:hypothetical protein STA3757_02730 [Stanieria sp. NIES-3757]|nr:hypothetical protein STA3757_02730 [Stanieria sp. NIES-3757]